MIGYRKANRRREMGVAAKEEINGATIAAEDREIIICLI